MKKLILCFVVLLLGLSLMGCNSPDSRDDNVKDDIKEPVPNEMLELTIDELKAYDGTNGMNSYIAYDGKIYDVTDVSAWSTGTHNGGMVGTDITDLISGAPHGTGVLDDLEQVGIIVEE